MNQLFLIFAVICFSIGALESLLFPGSKVNWQNAGLAFVTLSLVI